MQKSSTSDVALEKRLGPVVRRVDNFIQFINPYPMDNICSLSNQN